MRAIPRYILVNVNVNASTTAGSAIQFPDVPELNGCEIVGIETYDDSMLAKSPNGQTVIAAADLLKVVVTLQDLSSVERLREVPATTLQPVLMAGLYKQVVPFVVKWQASTVKFTDAPAGSPFTVPVGVFYIKG